jgi:hypothetical protein
MRTAAAAGLALTVVAVGVGGVSPARAVAAASMTARVTATRAVPAPAAGEVATALLINGDSVEAAGRNVSVLQPAETDGQGSVLGLNLAGQRYVVPVEALPYLGRGLDPDLFDVAALTKESGDELRVTVTYRGGVPSLPGVTITKAVGGIAQGYLTAASAEVFGAALARQFDEDHASGSYGTDGLFSDGVTITLAGGTGMSAAARPGYRRPWYEMHTLTVDGTNLAGKPDTGDLVVLVNVDDPAAFSGPDEWYNDFYDGTAKFSVPAGTYWAVGIFGEFGVLGVGLAASHASQAIPPTYAVVLPQFTVQRNTVIKMAERSADSKFAVTTPRPAQLESQTLTFNRVAADKAETSVIIAPAGAVYVSPTSRAPGDGTLEETAQAQLMSPASVASPYQYYVSFQGPNGIIPCQDFTVSPASLATVREGLYSDKPGMGSFTDFDIMAAFASEVANFMPVPGHETVYLTASTGGVPIPWLGHYDQASVPVTFMGHRYLRPLGGQDGLSAYQPGQVATEDWNEYPLHVAQRANLVGPDGFTNLAASRAGNVLTFAFWPFTDDTPGHAGSAGGRIGSGITVGGTYQIQQDGKTISAGQTGAGLFYQQVTLSPKPSAIRLTLNTTRSGGPYTESTADSATWTWRSAYAQKHLLPPGFTCGDGSQDCVSQPLLTLNYGVAGEALNGTTEPGPQQVTISVGHLQLAAGSKITHVAVEVSFNDGETWTCARLTGSDGTYTADFTAPASSYVTLRAQAADAAGGTMEETITRAYATAADPVTDGYRTCAQPAAPDEARCFVIWPAHRAAGTARVVAGTLPPGWGPRDIEAAYKLPVAGNPHQTVAVVEAYDNPDLASYLATYRKQYGLPACTAANGCFRVVNQDGRTAPLPKSGVGSGWDVESTLDVDMVSAACPHCRILVVDASSQDLSDFAAAEDTAVRLGASVISDSWGVREDGYAMTFARAYDHPGHIIVASSGDSGFDSANFPANLATVTATGGTELARSRNKRGWTEQVWDNGGGASSSGCSAYQPKPRWQHDPHCQMRTVADVSALAYNVAIYEAYWGGWLEVGGTSAASPLIAGVYALAGNAAEVEPGYEYSRAGSLFTVTVGSNDGDSGATCGHDYLCQAGRGYNAPTGLGTPDGTGAF